MANYSEILHEIDEQSADLNSSILQYQQEAEQAQQTIHDSQAKILQLQSQLDGLASLRVNAQTLIDNQNSLDIHLNVQVNADSAATNGLTINQGTPIVQDGPFS